MRQLILLGVLAVMLLSCSKPGPVTILDCPGEGRVQAEMIRKGCESYVFRLIEFSPEAQLYWIDIFSKNEYQNVISVLNYCGTDKDSKDLQDLNPGELVSFDLTITKERCLILCFAYEDSPTPSFNASKISRCSQKVE